MTKRKISCLPCRMKKVKCDGEKPCSRCQTRNTTCTYQKPGAVGRPPKNAVVNKLVLSKNDTSNQSKTFCREFIFENISINPVLATTRYLQDTKSLSLSYYIESLFSACFNKTAAINNNLKSNGLIRKGDYVYVSPKVKIYDLTHFFTWMGADIANILMRRISKLKLTYYSDLEFSTTALAYDCTTTFFETPSENSLAVNPLNSLPPQQAIRLIECFFCIHPYSVLLNKTMLLQSYWTDTTDPLLLTVVYGTTIFKSQLLDGKPLELWDALTQKKRNPFLDYAHLLLSKATSEATPSRYQAIVLLALFEVTFGFPKRGMSLFGLSYMIAARLGLLDNTMPPGLNEVEKELLLVTFWSAYECTIRGCVELEQIPRDALAHHGYPYPPVSVNVSKSYQYDVQNNNPRLFKSYPYLIETFYIKAVISRISCKLILQLPTPRSYILSRGATHDFFLNEDRLSTPPPKATHVELGIAAVLQEFKEFNSKHHHTFSPLQDFTLEMFRLFYTICLGFLRSSLTSADPTFSLHQRHLPDMLDLTDVNNILNLNRVLPDAICVIERTCSYLSDRTSYEEDCVFLPRGIIISAMDAAAQVLIYSYRVEPNEKCRYYLDLALHVLDIPVIWGDWGTADLLKSVISDFLKGHPPIILMPDLNINMSNVFSIGSDIHSVFNLSPSNSTSTSSGNSVSSFGNKNLMTSLMNQQHNYLANPWLSGNQDINSIIFSADSTNTLMNTLLMPTDRTVTIAEFNADATQQELNDFLSANDFTNVLTDLF